MLTAQLKLQKLFPNAFEGKHKRFYGLLLLRYWLMIRNFCYFFHKCLKLSNLQNLGVPVNKMGAYNIVGQRTISKHKFRGQWEYKKP